MRCLYAAALAAAALWRAPTVPPTAVAVPSRYGFLTDKFAPAFRRDEIEPLCCSRGIRKEVLGPPMLPEWSGLGGMDFWQSFSDTLDVNTSQSHTEIVPDMRQIAQNDHLVAQIPVPPDNNLCQVAWARATSDLILSDHTLIENEISSSMVPAFTSKSPISPGGGSTAWWRLLFDVLNGLFTACHRRATAVLSRGVV